MDNGTIYAVIGTGVALGGLMVHLQDSASRAIDALQRDIAVVPANVGDLRERMARLEGLMEGYTRREPEK